MEEVPSILSILMAYHIFQSIPQYIAECRKKTWISTYEMGLISRWNFSHATLAEGESSLPTVGLHVEFFIDIKYWITYNLGSAEGNTGKSYNIWKVYDNRGPMILVSNMWKWADEFIRDECKLNNSCTKSEILHIFFSFSGRKMLVIIVTMWFIWALHSRHGPSLIIVGLSHT